MRRTNDYYQQFKGWTLIRKKGKKILSIFMYISISRLHLTDLLSYIMKISSTGWFGTYRTGHQSGTTYKPLIFKLIKLLWCSEKPCSYCSIHVDATLTCTSHCTPLCSLLILWPHSVYQMASLLFNVHINNNSREQLKLLWQPSFKSLSLQDLKNLFVWK